MVKSKLNILFHKSSQNSFYPKWHRKRRNAESAQGQEPLWPASAYLLQVWARIGRKKIGKASPYNFNTNLWAGGNVGRRWYPGIQRPKTCETKKQNTATLPRNKWPIRTKLGLSSAGFFCRKRFVSFESATPSQNSRNVDSFFIIILVWHPLLLYGARPSYHLARTILRLEIFPWLAETRQRLQGWPKLSAKIIIKKNGKIPAVADGAAASQQQRQTFSVRLFPSGLFRLRGWKPGHGMTIIPCPTRVFFILV